jgi:N-methylhydantoinase A
LVATPVFDWSDLRPAAMLPGPALVDSTDTTVVIPPWWTAAVDGWGNLRLTPRAAQLPK